MGTQLSDRDIDRLVADAAPVIPDYAPPVERRERILAGSRAGSRPRVRVAAGALGVAGAALLATSLIPSGGSRTDPVLDRAIAATAPASDRIVVIQARVDAGGEGWDPELKRIAPLSLWEEKTTWIRFSSTGQVVGARTLITDGSGGENGPRAGVEDAFELVDGQPVSKFVDPTTKKVRTERSWPGTPLTFEAHRLLEAAENGDARARIDGEETIDGRKAHRLVVTAWDEEPLPPNIHERRELLIDAETFRPIVERVRSTGTTKGGASLGVPDGKPFDNWFTQRVRSYRELPDTPSNRELLKLEHEQR